MLGASPLAISGETGQGVGSMSHLLQTSFLTGSQGVTCEPLRVSVTASYIHISIALSNSQTWCPALLSDWGEAAWRPHAGPWGAGKEPGAIEQISPNGNPPVSQWPPRDHECGLVDEECSHSHSEKSPVSVLGPHTWPIIPATGKKNWTGPPARRLSALVTNQPRDNSKWLGALTSTPTSHTARSQPLPPGSPTPA